jgi:hypothetical protein
MQVRFVMFIELVEDDAFSINRQIEGGNIDELVPYSYCSMLHFSAQVSVIVNR